MIRDIEMQAAYLPAGPAARERHRRIFREGLPIEFLGILYFIMIVLAGVVLVWQPARVAEMNERIAGLEATLQGLRMRNESLKQAVTGVESLDYVEKEARTRLGMVFPEEVRTFSVTETVRESATVASLPKDETKTGGIFGLIGRIAQIFGVREAIAKGSGK